MAISSSARISGSRRNLEERRRASPETMPFWQLSAQRLDELPTCYALMTCGHTAVPQNDVKNYVASTG
jgi:hypothetical protein